MLIIYLPKKIIFLIIFLKFKKSLHIKIDN